MKLACMCDLIPFDKLARDPLGFAHVAGVFAVTKKHGRLRLIIDRRPWNVWEKSLHGLQLPHGMMFTKLVLSADEATL